MNKKFVIISLSVALLIVATITISSYAYFTISNKEGEENVITSGTMSLLFTDGNEITANSLLPGQSIEKEFTVKNNGNVDTSYDVYLSEVINTFVDKTDLVYELTSSDGGYNTISQLQVPSQSNKIVNNYSIGVNETHHYKLKITFLNKDENQDDNQGKIFSATIQINEYKDIETTINYYMENSLINTMPTKNAANYLTSNCDKNAQIAFDVDNWKYELININQNHTTCNIYFEKVLSSIEVTTPPIKTTYVINESLDLSGLVITANYSNGTSTVINEGITFTPNNNVSLNIEGNMNVVASYTDNNVTKTCNIPIVVQEKYAGNRLVFNLNKNTSKGGTITESNGEYTLSGGAFLESINPISLNTGTFYVEVKNMIRYTNTVYTGNDSSFAGLIIGTGNSGAYTQNNCFGISYGWGTNVINGFTGSGGYPNFSTSLLSANNWNRLAITYDGTTYKLYLNGVVRGTYNSATIKKTKLYVGGWSDAYYDASGNRWGFLNGTYRNIKVYNIALPASEL